MSEGEEAVAYRHAAYDTPWWVNANSQDGRFHTSLDQATQYWCLHPLGPAAEMLRHHVGAGHEDDYETVRLNLWAARIPLAGVERIGFAECGQFGVTPEELVGEDYSPTQELAARVRAAGMDGICVPSAALPGTENLVLFGTRVLHPYLYHASIQEEVPTGHLTEWAVPPQEVVPHVRWIGAEHRALSEWLDTGGYTALDDPDAIRR